jgi:peptidoglycan/LPS O-acetylase OafA/YrhL
MKVPVANRLQELDALRGIATMLIVFLHLTTENGKIKGFFTLGVTGVDLFFIISGFVILLTLEKTRNWQDFVVSRFSRLYPVYWASVILIGLLMFLRGTPFTSSWIKLFANMTMFQAYFKIKDLDGTSVPDKSLK